VLDNGSAAPLEAPAAAPATASGASAGVSPAPSSWTAPLSWTRPSEPHALHDSLDVARERETNGETLTSTEPVAGEEEETAAEGVDTGPASSPQKKGKWNSVKKRFKRAMRAL